jgi:hypothetical protein
MELIGQNKSELPGQSIVPLPMELKKGKSFEALPFFTKLHEASYIYLRAPLYNKSMNDSLIFPLMNIAYNFDLYIKCNCS